MEEERLLVLRPSGRFFERARRSRSSRATQSPSQYAVLLVRLTLLAARPSLGKRDIVLVGNYQSRRKPAQVIQAGPQWRNVGVVTLGPGGSRSQPYFVKAQADTSVWSWKFLSMP